MPFQNFKLFGEDPHTYQHVLEVSLGVKPVSDIVHSNGTKMFFIDFVTLNVFKIMSRGF